uniref:Response regulatory domain-containing protein n=2 Tax=Amphora coffeiformis TaxID=265554 RepID=A0A7S3P4X5_9STRA
MARQVFGVKISFISIIDLGRCLFLALDGLDIRQVPRRQTFCSHAVISSQDFYEVRDAQQDAIFCQYPMVKAGLVRYYAAYPLVCPDTGYRLGCFTIVDDTPRPAGLSETQRQTLQLLARVAMQDLRKHRQVSQARQQLRDMAQHVATLSHDLVTPLSGVQMALSLLQQSLSSSSSDGWTAEQQESLDTLHRCTAAMERTCNQLRDTLRGDPTLDISSSSSKATNNNSNNEKVEKDSINITTKRKEERQNHQTNPAAASPISSCKRQKMSPVTPLEQHNTNNDEVVLVRPKTSAMNLTEKQPQHQRTALVVEDAALVRKIMARALERLGWQVVQAENGQVGLHLLQQRLYDVCFMDFLMPVLDGFDCCRLLREWETTHRPSPQQRQYIVGMSAHASPKDAEQGLVLGMNDFVSKPLKFDDLQALLKGLPPLSLTGCGDKSIAITHGNNALHLPPLPPPESQQELEHSCLLIGSPCFVSAVEQQIKQKTKWTVTTATLPNVGGSTLRSRHWSLVLVDNACFSGDDNNNMTGTQFLQDFREWEQHNRIHLQRHVFLCGASLSSVLPCHGKTTKVAACLPKGVDGTLQKPIQNHDLEAVLQASEQCRLGEELLTRY